MNRGRGPLTEHSNAYLLPTTTLATFCTPPRPAAWHRRGGVKGILMRESLILVAVTVASASLLLGCAVTVAPPVVASNVVVDGPAVEGPVIDGGVAIDVEPPMEERVYVYDAGFPPGVYLDGGFYWYGGYRYPQDVFVSGYVAANIRGGRFADAAANRRAGVAIEAQHRAEFARTGGKRSTVGAGAQAARPQAAAAHAEATAAHPEATAAHPEATGAHPQAAAVRQSAPRPQAAPRPAPGKRK